jgi:hypothetical protein
MRAGSSSLPPERGQYHSPARRAGFVSILVTMIALKGRSNRRDRSASWSTATLQAAGVQGVGPISQAFDLGYGTAALQAAGSKAVATSARLLPPALARYG